MRVNLRVTNQSESFRKNASNNCYDRGIFLEYSSIYLANLIDKDLKKKIDLVTSYSMTRDRERNAWLKTCVILIKPLKKIKGNASRSIIRANFHLCK